MKYNLSAIQKTLEDITKTIKSVINVEVTIADSNLTRITASGSNLTKVGERISKTCVFSKALESKESFIIENPRVNIRCIDCDKKNECIEAAQVCCPIIVQGQAAGVIGLIAFDADQKKRIVENEINLLDFLKNMSKLIAAKLIEHESTQRIKRLANELDTTMDLLDIGVIYTDEKGRIERSNKTAQEYFSKNQLAKGKTIENILSLSPIGIVDTVKNKSFNYSEKERKFHGFYSVHPIIYDNETKGYVFTITELEELISVLSNIAGKSREITFDNIISENKEMISIINHAKQFARGNSSILIQGESGTGKELFARALHNESPRKDYPFIAVNCSALPENLIESELFGYEEGSFTGAKKGGNPGKFELAGEGTIFLDEIGDMPLHLQSKLLRVLQEKTFTRVGGNKSISMDARVISATNKNLETMVAESEFREDLYFRLNVIPIHIPSLRQRKDDIMILSNVFLRKFSNQFNKEVKYFEDELVDFLTNYSWPGNIRELENTVEYLVNISEEDFCKKSSLPNRLKKHFYDVESAEAETTPEKESINVMTIEEVEKNEIKKALKLYGRNSSGIDNAAEALNIGRATLYRKIKKYGL
ncbi:Transcriptional regulator containing PAS, AAA-type ATPase, and DNA-binding Fis domains [Dethiosulfatibacter aminovorans DSM 17477]|uniref:Transcriptional regulator containing PAS, AAA-type ATPase, and DNA-binding Fis domains n=1 Tax=Dethiosulfatibacter aminovorans DSM 17477 TaxID=1121476 RepID=A0A1M6GYZ2_9FIRM|nr:sigma 54-interacting transcriptional regulator [Dethiosulfatibacter aminovorans]SHJ15181.1 Transcriptional regulator containing PAS, AAA-type ATPase, and DNA-binding Fis domains [Dethiosulfatibacter aminovorans DSM 17477]